MLTVKDTQPYVEPQRAPIQSLPLGTVFVYGTRDSLYMKIDDVRVIDWNNTVYNAVSLKSFSAVSFSPSTVVTPILDSQLIINSGGYYNAEDHR